MGKYKVYQIEPLGAATVPMLITTGYTNPGGHFKGEFFLAIPDSTPYFKAQRFRFNEKAFEPGAAVLDEDFMLRLAFQRAAVSLLEFIRTASKKNGAELYARKPEILESDQELILNYWIAGACNDHLIEIGRQTEVEDLTEYIKWVLTLPEFDKRDL